uniref:C-type lectin domain-containing protein n=1 Tax=Steinernema glaseri TaxID=37863 RepID=A0A1I7ZPX5_9BILA
MREKALLLCVLFLSSHGQVLYQYTMENHVHFPNVDFSTKIFDDGDRITVDCQAGQKCKLCSNWYKAGDPCNDGQELEVIQCNSDLNIVEVQENAFYACKNQRLELEFCPRGSLYNKAKGCYDPTKQMYRQAHASAFPGSGRVGDVCAFNTDCLSKNFLKYRSYNSEDSLLEDEPTSGEEKPGPSMSKEKKFVLGWDPNPGSVDWCPENTHVARETRDGWVCVSLKDQGTGGSSDLYFICPLPEGAGFKIALNDPDP